MKKRKNINLVCPRCGAPLYHEATHLGAIRHSCSNRSCSYEIYGVITDGSCPECNSLEKEKKMKNSRQRHSPSFKKFLEIGLKERQEAIRNEAKTYSWIKDFEKKSTRDFFRKKYKVSYNFVSISKMKNLDGAKVKSIDAYLGYMCGCVGGLR